MAERDLQKEFDVLRQELTKLQEDLARVAEQGGTVAVDAAAVAKERLEDEASRLIARIQEAAESAADKGKHVVADVERRVEEQPVSSALTALALGVVVGWLMSRK
jgi:ElaB/YqjD/DUF883 family membrane-anchored ribosome-binding protein